MSRWHAYEEVHGPDHTVSGTVLVWPRLEGPPGIPGREILAYLPPSLAAMGAEKAAAAGRRYPVLYFHDGQNVFDARTSHSGEWRRRSAGRACWRGAGGDRRGDTKCRRGARLRVQPVV